MNEGELGFILGMPFTAIPNQDLQALLKKALQFVQIVDAHQSICILGSPCYEVENGMLDRAFANVRGEPLTYMKGEIGLILGMPFTEIPEQLLALETKYIQFGQTVDTMHDILSMITLYIDGMKLIDCYFGRVSVNKDASGHLRKDTHLCHTDLARFSRGR